MSDDTASATPTPLQCWLVETVSLILEAHGVLSATEYEVYIDVLHRRLTGELVELHLDEWRAA